MPRIWKKTGFVFWPKMQKTVSKRPVLIFSKTAFIWKFDSTKNVALQISHSLSRFKKNCQSVFLKVQRLWKINFDVFSKTINYLEKLTFSNFETVCFLFWAKNAKNCFRKTSFDFLKNRVFWKNPILPKM